MGPQLTTSKVLLYTTFCHLFQNAGAIIGKGGTNIKRLRSDVSTFWGKNEQESITAFLAESF